MMEWAMPQRSSIRLEKRLAVIASLHNVLGNAGQVDTGLVEHGGNRLGRQLHGGWLARYQPLAYGAFPCRKRHSALDLALILGSSRR